ncbi:MAG: hypothetical protein H6905_08290 [Hyphomicrobiales bacterium]|nr:hypothetical protein [Hyphomicrobiales bacterium]
MPQFIRLAMAMQLEWIYLTCKTTQKVLEASLLWPNSPQQTQKPAMLPVPVKRER